MKEIISFLIKIIIASLIISLMIKYLGSFLYLAPTNLNAMIMVMILPLIITLFLSNKILDKSSNS